MQVPKVWLWTAYMHLSTKNINRCLFEVFCHVAGTSNVHFEIHLYYLIS